MKARRYALLLAGGYFLVAAAYILVSGRIAAGASGDVESLRRAESTKGLLFVFVTGVALFLFAWRLFARIERDAERLDRQREAMLASERRAVAGLLAATVAHDFNNFMTGVLGGLDLVRHAPELSQATRDLVRETEAAARRGVELSNRLIEIGRGRAAGERCEVELGSFVRETVALLRKHPAARGCELRVVAPDPVHAHVYPLLVQQLVLNLVLNAAEAMRGKGVIEVRVVPDANGAVVEVHDTGPGVPEAARGHLFEAFFTTKPDGTGLGLVSVRACAEMHEGDVRVERSPLGGACFRARLGAARG